MPPKHQKMGRISCALVPGRVVGIDHRRDIRFPFGFLVVLESIKLIEQCLVKTLWHSIARRVLGRCSRFFHIGNRTQLFYDPTFETASLVAMETRGKAVMTNEIVKNKSGCCLGSLVLKWECLSIAGEMICNNQNIFVSTR